MDRPQPALDRARTKTVATVGPASIDPETLAGLVALGVDVFRVNMAHGSRGQHEQAVAAIREVSRQYDRPIGILVDLAGPKIRLGQLYEEPLRCEHGAMLDFVQGDIPEAPDQLISSYAPLIRELSEGDQVVLADGTVSLAVEQSERDRVRCRVVQPGILRSRQGINLPGVKLSVDSMTDADRANAEWAAQNEIDFIGLSFVRKASDIQDLKEQIDRFGSKAKVIAKIEKQEALDNLEAIIQITDGVMVARGDLGVETDVAQVPMAQKRIIGMCNRLGRPVIVATQMLDSMQHTRHPTRAEVTDVANAIIDGADACMLSGETAIGEYPCEAVAMMNRVMTATEATLRDSTSQTPAAAPIIGVHPITSAVVYGAGQIAECLSAKLVVIATRSGATALAKSTQRDFIPTIAVSDEATTLRQMALLWGIIPVNGAPALSGLPLREFVDDWGHADGSLRPSDRIVLVTGSGINPGVHNQVLVHEAGSSAKNE